MPQQVRDYVTEESNPGNSKQVECVEVVGPFAGFDSDLVLIEAVAAGPDGALCAIGSHPAAAVAYCSEKPVWLVASRGRRLPSAMWSAMTTRLDEAGDGWDHDVEVVPLAMVTGVFGPEGLGGADTFSMAAECPVAHELLRMSAM